MAADNPKRPSPTGPPPPKGGRPPGAANKVTRDARRFAQEIIEQPEVLDQLKLQMQGGIGNRENQMPASAFKTLMGYGYGLPKHVVEIQDGTAKAFEHETDDELRERAEAIARGAIAPVPPREAN